MHRYTCEELEQLEKLTWEADMGAWETLCSYALDARRKQTNGEKLSDAEMYAIIIEADTSNTFEYECPFPVMRGTYLLYNKECKVELITDPMLDQIDTHNTFIGWDAEAGMTGEFDQRVGEAAYELRF